MKKLFAIFALVAFFGAIASPVIASSFSTPIAIEAIDDKPKKAKVAADAEKKEGCATEKKEGCATEKKACCGSEKK